MVGGGSLSIETDRQTPCLPAYLLPRSLSRYVKDEENRRRYLFEPPLSKLTPNRIESDWI